MAGGIKGITVKIGGDTTELGRALTSAQKQSSALQRELKGVNTLLKMDPKNVTLLKQKQELLTKAVEETKNKLNALKEVMAKVDAGEIEMTEEEYRNLQREIAATEQKLKGLEAEQKEFGSVGAQVVAAYGEKLQALGGKFEAVGQKMLPVSGIIGGLGAAAVKTASDFDSSMSNVSAISGATGKDLEALRDKAREMGAQTKFSASESADAMSYMAMAGWKTEDMLQGISGVMNLAAASGEDLAKTSDILTDGLTAFGLSAKDSARMADVMAAASSNANTNVSLLGESYKYCASTAGAMGYSLEDVTESLSLMANAGVKGSQAGTSLKTAMINLAKPTAQMQAAMDKYGISITNTDGSMKSWGEVVENLRGSLGGLSEAEQTSAAATIFGKEAVAGMLSVINAAPKDVDKLNKAINNSSGAAEKMANTMQDNLAGQLTILKSQLEELAISFGELLMPAIRSIVGAIQGFVDKLNALPGAAKAVILVIAAIVAAIGPILIIIGKLLIAIGTIMTFAPQIVTAIGVIKGGLLSLWGVLMANPIILIVTAIAALVAAFIYAYNHSEKFRNIVNAAFTAVKNVVISVVEVIKTVVIAVWTAIVTDVTTRVNLLKTVVTTVWNAIKSVVTTVNNAVKSVVTSAWNAIKSTVTTVVNGIKSTISTVFNSLKGIVKTAFDAVKTNIINPLNNAWEKVKDIVGKIRDKVKNIFDGIKPKLNLSLPKVSVSGGKAPWGIGGKGSLPSFHVSWNKLGAIFKKPTIFNTPLGFQGVGEAGAEAVAPIETLIGYVRTAVNDSDIGERISRVENILAEYLPSIASGKQIVLDTGTLVGETIDKIDSALADNQTLKARGV